MPSKSRYSIGWSSTCTAARLTPDPGSVPWAQPSSPARRRFRTGRHSAAAAPGVAKRRTGEHSRRADGRVVPARRAVLACGRNPACAGTASAFPSWVPAPGGCPQPWPGCLPSRAAIAGDHHEGRPQTSQRQGDSPSTAIPSRPEPATCRCSPIRIPVRSPADEFEHSSLRPQRGTLAGLGCICRKVTNRSACTGGSNVSFVSGTAATKAFARRLPSV